MSMLPREAELTNGTIKSSFPKQTPPCWEDTSQMASWEQMDPWVGSSGFASIVHVSLSPLGKMGPHVRLRTVSFSIYSSKDKQLVDTCGTPLHPWEMTPALMALPVSVFKGEDVATRSYPCCSGFCSSLRLQACCTEQGVTALSSSDVGTIRRQSRKASKVKKPERCKV